MPVAVIIKPPGATAKGFHHQIVASNSVVILKRDVGFVVDVSETGKAVKNPLGTGRLTTGR